MDPYPSPHKERLWTPWRMRYISGESREQGCIFCNRLERHDDVDSLILYRGEHLFVIMNLFPYNTGHVMIVPNTHEADITALDRSTLIEMATLLPTITSALQRVLGCQGFNIGLNLGSIAGAGVAEHLHQHVVPRWEGDANFMPILAGTMVIPELIPQSYARIRAELDRALYGSTSFDAVLVTEYDPRTFWLRNGNIPKLQPDANTSVSRALISAFSHSGREVVGWSGAVSTLERDTPPGLVIRVDAAPGDESWARVLVDEHAAAFTALKPSVRDTLLRAVNNLAPWVAPPQ